MTKSFGDANAYAAEIRRVVPGHDLLRELAIATLEVRLPRQGTLLVIGCGPGAELLDVARALPEWRIEALEPSHAMFECAAEVVEQAGLAARVRVEHRPLAAPEAATADAALCLLVAHLVPVEARAAFWHALGASVRPGGLLALAEIEAMTPQIRAIWRAWSKGRGCAPERLATLDARLTTGFALLTAVQTTALAADAGFAPDGVVARQLGVSLTCWRKGSP